MRFPTAPIISFDDNRDKFEQIWRLIRIYWRFELQKMIHNLYAINIFFIK